MEQEGKVITKIDKGIALIRFHHPKSNALPAYLLKELTAQVKSVSKNDAAVVVILESEGDQAFCAGALFDELLTVKDKYAGTEFFMGFANLINAMRECPKFIIARVHGKVIGGGVGVVAASDYVFALDTAQVRLSELGAGLGPFVVGPAVERKIGKSAFIELAIDHDWHTAEWAKEKGLYNHIYSTPHDMDDAIIKFAHKISLCNPEAMEKLKTIFWEGSEDWDVLLQSRAALSGELVTSDFTKNFIRSFKRK